MTKPHCDVLIVGSGASGLISAISLAQKGLNVIVTTKDAVTESSSSWAQGGIAVPLASSDSVQKHIEDTLKVGQGHCNPAVVKFYIESIKACIETLDTWGVPFVGFHNGIVKTDELGREGAHSERRILRVGSDISGRILMKTLWEIACRHPKISISQGTSLLRLLTNSSKEVVGGYFQDINNNLFPIYAPATILATGGLSSLFEKSTNPYVSVGDGIVCAQEIGAGIKDLEFIQFHPTALDTGNCFLLSEALRGEGAILLNANQERFMSKYDSQNMELAPRAVVSRAVWKEINLTGRTFLDVRPIGESSIRSHFQGIFENCQLLGFDMTKDLLPITPAAHYTIGGVATNLESKTSVSNLWAVGETACTGLHGADRLASNSLLECVVSGFKAAESIESLYGAGINAFKNSEPLPSLATTEKVFALSMVEVREKSQNLKNKMWKFVSFDRDKEQLQNFQEELEVELQKLSNQVSDNPHLNSFVLQLKASQLVVQAVLKRPESLAAHQVKARI